MLKRILNNGVYPDNTEVLNRKIRISNLIALITVGMFVGYAPMFYFFYHPADLTIILVFFTVAVMNFPLVKRKKYMLSFTLNIVMAYIYFIWAAIAYGLQSNVHFFLLIMCLVVVIFYDNKLLIKSFLAFSVLAFFGVNYLMYNKEGLIPMGAELKPIQIGVGFTMLFMLFVIVSILILFFKNDNLRYQIEVTEKSKIIEEKNKDIIDSINYATRIQKALLPNKKTIEDNLPGSFVVFRPKDIVSGDFFWTHETTEHIYVAVGDCTGHGVPRALMSVLGMNLLNEIVEGKGVHEPSVILDQLRSGIIKALNKDDVSGEYKDGMDIQLVRIDRKNGHCSFSCANNPLYVYKENQLHEFKADKQPVGLSPEMKPFTNQAVQLNNNDFLFLFTDGYADQFGGANNKKFMYKNFKQILFSSIQKDVAQRVDFLNNTFDEWKGSNEQVDDICIIGLNIKTTTP